jgi:hypothetical protein
MWRWHKKPDNKGLSMAESLVAFQEKPRWSILILCVKTRILSQHFRGTEGRVCRPDIERTLRRNMSEMRRTKERGLE